jgi:hypothetical protein
LGNKTKPANKSVKQTKNLPINPCETNKQKSREPIKSVKPSEKKSK